MELFNQLWRLEHLYWIENKAGKLQRFRLNRAQRKVHEGLWYRNDILKARQLGISTYVALLILDYALFCPNFHAGIIDKTLPDAQLKLAKIRFAWQYLDFSPADATQQEKILANIGAEIKHKSGQLKAEELRMIVDSKNMLGFANGSTIRIGTNLRGGTMQLLHVSELAHVSVHAPWRAQAIRTGAINTVPLLGMIVKECTHEGGRYGVNYDITRQAMENAGRGEMSPLDFKFFFLSWFDCDDYRIHTREQIVGEMELYFQNLELEHGVKLDLPQQRWYAQVARTMGVAMRQEYPSTPDEAFIAGNEGSIYGAKLANLRAEGRVGVDFAVDATAPLFTAWDLGLSDHTVIWLVQMIGHDVYWVDCHLACQEPIQYYASVVHAWEQTHGRAITAHFLPHDAGRRDPHKKSYLTHLAEAGISPCTVVPRTCDIWLGINHARELLNRSIFHRRTLARVLNKRGESQASPFEHIELYRAQVPTMGGRFVETPVHDEHSHTADALRTFAEACSYNLTHPINLKTVKPNRARVKL